MKNKTIKQYTNKLPTSTQIISSAVPLYIIVSLNVRFV